MARFRHAIPSACYWSLNLHRWRTVNMAATSIGAKSFQYCIRLHWITRSKWIIWIKLYEFRQHLHVIFQCHQKFIHFLQQFRKKTVYQSKVWKTLHNSGWRHTRELMRHANSSHLQKVMINSCDQHDLLFVHVNAVRTEWAAVFITSSYRIDFHNGKIPVFN